MKFNFKVEGIDKLIKDLEKIGSQVEEVARPEKHSLAEILNDNFIRENTPFSSLDDFLEKAGIKTEDDLNSPAVNKFIRDNTPFENFEEMFEAAGQELMMRKLDENVDW